MESCGGIGEGNRGRGVLGPVGCAGYVEGRISGCQHWKRSDWRRRAYVASEEAADAAGVERASGVGKPKSTAEVEQRVEAIGHILYGVGRGR